MYFKSEIFRNTRLVEAETAKQLKTFIPTALQHSMTPAREKVLITALPIREFGFILHKGSFRDPPYMIGCQVHYQNREHQFHR